VIAARGAGDLHYFEAALNLPVLQLIACDFLCWEASDTFSCSAQDANKIALE
jgi:hypothetical protein